MKLYNIKLASQKSLKKRKHYVWKLFSISNWSEDDRPRENLCQKAKEFYDAELITF
jgi:hypothetical protein